MRVSDRCGRKRAARERWPESRAGSLTRRKSGRSFTQGHNAFHANADDPRQLGLIEGSLGLLAAGDALLGYVTLPAEIDVYQPMDIYWNDRRLVATLRR